MQVFDDTVCTLGEGPMWHPERGELFWFDILGKRMFAKGAQRREWVFDEHVSACGWVDRDTLLMASASGLWRFDIPTGDRELVTALEAGNPVTRSNDGRADPQGGFWIGTMGLNAEPYAGAIYRFYRGELRQFFDRITISNAICFAPDGTRAYFADTFSQQIQTVGLDAHGWPAGEVEVFVDLRADDLNPDGAVVDADGAVWSAQWGASRIACYGPDGSFLRAIEVPTSQASCPAFGGHDATTLFVTTAAVGVQDTNAGKTFYGPAGVTGQREHQVIL
ncbi:SMP-30/gluconolactonase/LRE family protein [uncultured Tateyamaria sp.]|uniref:SMP-30/gluconolactonase/LRE family protein n=1 Tax=uncultured Tateyamaria sp. TaxID=455651 RepID=UPI002634BD8F|nr:SMP-30/gluconolactonase/LRE family protein [uncultured Tateyamaria sp.]